MSYPIEDILKELSINNSEKALQTLHNIYYDKLVRFVYLYIQSYESVEEIVSDVFLSIWIKRKELTHIENFNAYIFTVAKNTAISYFRKERKTISIKEASTELYSITTITPEDEYISEEMLSILHNAIEELPPQCKKAFKLIKEEKMAYKDVSLILNISIKTLEAHITKATKTLRNILEKFK